MGELRGREGQNHDRPDWKTVYEEVCRQHDGIDAFRAKLLGLLPLASGSAGIFLLLSNPAKDAAAMPHLLAIGTFGFLTGLGLFRYELRGIQKCSVLIECAKELEKKHLMRKDDGPGAFARRPDEVSVAKISADVTGAAMIIYPTVLAGWAYMACLGFLSLAGGASPPSWWTMITALVLAVGVLLGSSQWGWKVRRRQREQQAEAKRRRQPATASPVVPAPA